MKLLLPSHVAAERRGEKHVFPDLITVVGSYGIDRVRLDDNSPYTALDAYMRRGKGIRTFHIKNNPLAGGVK